MLPLISFETGRKTLTQSSGQRKCCASKWKSGSISNRNHGREANTRGEESEKIYTGAPLEARRESLCPLDKDLSWRSANGKVTPRTPYLGVANLSSHGSLKGATIVSEYRT